MKRGNINVLSITPVATTQIEYYWTVGRQPTCAKYFCRFSESKFATIPAKCFASYYLQIR